MRKCLLAVLLIAVVRSGLAQEKAPVPYSASVYPSYGSAAAPENDKTSPITALSKADHLRLAAEHLEAAGLIDEAQQVRKKEAEERASVVVVNLRMLEYSRFKLSQRDSQRYGGSKGTSLLEWLSKLQGPGTRRYTVSEEPADSRLLSLIEALCKDELMNVLNRPTLMVRDDEPASVQVGGEQGFQAMDAQGKEIKIEYGTHVDLVAHVASKDRVRLEIRYCKSDLDLAHSVQVGDQKIPGLNVREIATTVDVRSKGTIVIDAGVEQRKRAVASPPGSSGDKPDVEEFQTLVLLTAEIVTKDNAAAVKAALRR